MSDVLDISRIAVTIMITRSSQLKSATVCLAILVVLTGCEGLFVSDGDQAEGISPKGGYFYLIDNGAFDLLMLDRDLTVLKKWDTGSLSGNEDVRGIAFDDRNFWLSVAGDKDSIYKVSGFGDELVILDSFEAPPEGKGVVRDLAWDGSYLWALNSGSETYSIPPRLYKIDPANFDILDEYDLPTPEPRALKYVGTNEDVYGYGPELGLYYTDVEKDFVYFYDTSKRLASEYFETPEPPRGSSYKYAAGLSWDGEMFWLINTNSVVDHLYRLDYNGNEKARVDLVYTNPGAVEWSLEDARQSTPDVMAVAPNTGTPGDTVAVTVFGSGFLPGDGLEIDFGAGIDVLEDSTVYVSGSELHTVIVIDPAALGWKDITVTNPTGKSGAGLLLFLVTDNNPLDGFIWIGDASNGILSKVRISDETVVSQWDVGSFSGSSSIRGLAFDGTHMWMSIAGTEDRIFELDTDGVDLSFISAIPAPPGTPDGIVRDITFDDAGDLWAINSDAADGIQKIYRLDKTDGTILDSIDPPATNTRGMTFAQGRLYCNDYSLDYVYVYDFSSDSWSEVFEAPIPPGGTASNRYPVGMSWDGINLWMGNSTYEFDYIFQLTLSGFVLKTITPPNQGSAQITGVAHTAE